jgi:hypothetical protein
MRRSKSSFSRTQLLFLSTVNILLRTVSWTENKQLFGKLSFVPSVEFCSYCRVCEYNLRMNALNSYFIAQTNTRYLCFTSLLQNNSFYIFNIDARTQSKPKTSSVSALRFCFSYWWVASVAITGFLKANIRTFLSGSCLALRDTNPLFNEHLSVLWLWNAFEMTCLYFINSL